MCSPRFPRTCATSSCRYPIRFAFRFLLVVGVATPARAQNEALVEPLAGILAASDARRFTGPLFRAAARHPDPIVRRHAALSMGRIGNPAAISILLRLSSDPDTVVQRDALFAIGLLAVPEALDRLRDIVLNTPSQDQGRAHAEAVAAVAKTGGPDAAAIVRELLNRWVGIATTDNVPSVVERALLEAWRLGSAAPILLIAQFTQAASAELRWRAVYSLVALRATSASNALLRTAADPLPLVRALGVAALTADYADDAGLDRRGVGARLGGLVNDSDAGVRIAALTALGTYGTGTYVSLAADRAADTHPNVRVQALASLGRMTGQAAIDALTHRLEGGIFATRRMALLSLAQVAGVGALPTIRASMADNDWRRRSVAATALGSLPLSASRVHLESLRRDPDERVMASALQASLRSNPRAADSLARLYASHDDPVVRQIAIGALRARADTGHVRLLADAFEIGRADRTSSARVEVIAALGRISQQGSLGTALIAGWFLSRHPSSEDYLVRRAAARWLPAAADLWGPSRPIDTGRGIADYRDLARTVLAAERGASRTEIVFETDRGDLVVELFPADAPFTVQSFLRLVDRRHFDGLVWYAVEPGVMVASGDRRGDGLANVVAPVRDEPSARPFQAGSLGLVLDGPDTGGNRFFITLRPSPGLGSTHTAFGRVVVGLDLLDRLTLNDRIRRVRRR